MSGPIWDGDEIRIFLRAVDRHLTEPTRIIVIGGGAASLAYGATSTTDDLDTFDRVSDALAAAVARAVAETGLDIPVSQSTVADIPGNADARYERHLAEPNLLEVWVLERHDLALSKALRADEHDLQQLAEIHQAKPLSLATLVHRFHDEMSHAVGAPAIRQERFLRVVEHLFGELGRVEAEQLIAARR